MDSLPTLIEEAALWLNQNKLPAETENESINDSAECVMVIPDHDFEKVTKYLKRTKMWRITFDGDKEPTIFKMVNNQLMGYDSRYPKGRKVEKTSDMAFTEMTPTSTRGLVDKIISTHNEGGYCDKNISLSRMFYTMLPEDTDISQHLCFLTAFFMLAQRNGAHLEPCNENSFAFVFSNEIPEETTLVLQYLLQRATGKSIQSLA